MATVALSKSSLQQQRDRLRLFERFLPSLELKRQQLTAAYKKAVQVLAEAEQGVDQASRSLAALLPILGSARMQLSGLVRIPVTLISPRKTSWGCACRRCGPSPSTPRTMRCWPPRFGSMIWRCA
jgi:hypothetical protein